MKKPLTLPELAAAGIFLFGLYLAVLFFRSGLPSVESAAVTGLVVILIEILLLGFSRLSRRLKRASRSASAARSLAKTGRRSKRHL